MKILAIETSCDETAIAIIEGEERGSGNSGKLGRSGAPAPRFRILGNALYSQVSKHAEYGGVYPNLARREHQENLVPILTEAMRGAAMFSESKNKLSDRDVAAISKILGREEVVREKLLPLISSLETPDIDAIAVTYGPGLEPALWVGINFARALSLAWQKPLVPINHMEGHLMSAFFNENENSRKSHRIKFPVLGLLVSGGHTELVLMRDFLHFETVGETRDDAVGEAFDKVARMLSLPYPGGPEISKLAQKARSSKPAKVKPRRDRQDGKNGKNLVSLPRPMIDSDNLDFSFSGLKTAVLYALREFEVVTEDVTIAFAAEFENAAVDVLVHKTLKAVEAFSPKTLVLGGGVSANTHLRENLRQRLAAEFSSVVYLVPEMKLSTDNAVMIAVAAYFRLIKNPSQFSINPVIKAVGNLRLS